MTTSVIRPIGKRAPTSEAPRRSQAVTFEASVLFLSLSPFHLRNVPREELRLHSSMPRKREVQEGSKVEKNSWKRIQLDKSRIPVLGCAH
jgi:hypothetical protein